MFGEERRGFLQLKKEMVDMATRTKRGSVPSLPVEGIKEGAPTRKRRSKPPVNIVPDTYAETTTLIQAVLQSRGGQGASPETLHTVIAWAQSVREEGEELRELSSRMRRQKPIVPRERLARYELNRALLDGVLAGAIALRVEDSGQLLFLNRESLATPVPSSGAETAVDENGTTLL
jgi:hypothetical protein